MLHMDKIPLYWLFTHAVIVAACCFTDVETGPGSGVPTQPNGDRFKIEGRAIVPGTKTQDWASAARVLVDGEEHIGFLR